MGGAERQVKLTMRAETVTALLGSGFYLYGLRGARSSDLSGRPLVWFGTRRYSLNNEFACADQYEAYVSTSPLVAGGRVVVGSSFAIGLGQTLQVEAGGVGAVLGAGPPSAISFSNLTATEFTCGLTSPRGGAFAPVCAFPLHGNTLGVLAPGQRLLLLFCTSPVAAGAVAGRGAEEDREGVAAPDLFGAAGAVSSGILIDLTTAGPFGVTFDIDEGWSWGEQAWGQTVAPGADLVPLLIETPVA